MGGQNGRIEWVVHDPPKPGNLQRNLNQPSGPRLSISPRWIHRHWTATPRPFDPPTGGTRCHVGSEDSGRFYAWDGAAVSGRYRGFVRRPMKRTTPVPVSRIRKMNG